MGRLPEAWIDRPADGRCGRSGAARTVDGRASRRADAPAVRGRDAPTSLVDFGHQAGRRWSPASPFRPRWRVAPRTARVVSAALARAASSAANEIGAELT